MLRRTEPAAAAPTPPADAAVAPERERWPAGPAPETVAETLRGLELTINRRLDGFLHGNHQGLTPGHGTEPGESRPYHPGDDVRRIDWNVTARTRETYVREQIADRDLEAWIVVDVSASMHFGTTNSSKLQIALAAAACVGFLTARNQNRVGAVLVAGPQLKVMQPRGGRNQVRAILSSIASPPPSEGRGRSDMRTGLERVGRLNPRRGFTAVIGDFGGTDWADPLRRLGLRHDLLAISIADPRELDVPPIGLVDIVDPATGERREVHVTAAVQRRYAAAAQQQRDERVAALRSSRAELIELSTESDWLTVIAKHLLHRRRQVAGHHQVMG